MSITTVHIKDFELESGIVLPQVKIAYKFYGKLNADKSNVIWVCHALTANADVKDWWPEMFGPGRVLDPEKYFIVCPNFLGSCYGSTGAASEEVPEEYRGKNFPLISIQDMVKAHRLVAKNLGIKHIHLLIGASLGGQQALQWAVSFPEDILQLCVLATNAFHSPWGIAFNASQRMAMEADESFENNLPNGGKAGLKAARSIALLSYRTPEIYNESQAEKSVEKTKGFKAESYQIYQGQKLVNRFDPYCYYGITKSMDSHNLGRGFKSVEEALAQIKAKTLCIAITSDHLFLPSEVKFLAKNIPSATYQEIDSIFGHDGFLVEANQINHQILSWKYHNIEPKEKKTMKITKIGLFGYGCVGQGFNKLLEDSPDINAKITKIVVKNKYKKRDLPEDKFYFQPSDILIDNDIDTVVELIDDADAAYDIVKSALKMGKHVVSANKKMIAHNLNELVKIAKENEVSFLYEASVCASIPIIRNLENYFKSDIIEGFQGICNGTTNYILSQTSNGLTYEEALEEAQNLGFAESDPTLDVDGFDAKYKLGILLKHAFGTFIKPNKIFNCGIRHILPHHISFAEEYGCKIKLYSYAKKIDDKTIGFVAPFLVPKSHPNYNVENEFNAVNVNARFAHEQLFHGRGAGSVPTASAVLSDLLALQNGYHYKYKDGNATNFTNDFYLKILLTSTDKKGLYEIEFEHIENISVEENYAFKIGWVHFKNLQTINFNTRKDLFFAVFGEDFKLKKSDLEISIEEAMA